MVLGNQCCRSGGVDENAGENIEASKLIRLIVFHTRACISSVLNPMRIQWKTVNEYVW